MSKKAKAITIFIISFILASILIGYLKIKNVQIDWVAGTSTWNKLPEYKRIYMLNFWGITFRAIVVALIPTFLSTVRTEPYE